VVDAPASASSNPPLAAVNSGTGKLGPGFLRNRPGLRCPRLRSLGMTSKTQKASIPRRHIANTVTEDVTNHSHDSALGRTFAQRP